MIVRSKKFYVLRSMNLKFTKFDSHCSPFGLLHVQVILVKSGQSSSKLKIENVEEMFFISSNRVLLSFLFFYFYH